MAVHRFVPAYPSVTATIEPHVLDETAVSTLTVMLTSPLAVMLAPTQAPVLALLQRTSKKEP